MVEPLPSSFTLDELVEAAQERLADVVPAEARAASLNPRLVRSYQSLGLIDKPEREGREARYGRRQLLQLLVIRRLLSEGWTTGTIGKVIHRDDRQLEALLSGGVEVTVEAANPALAFLARIKARESEVRESGPRLSAPPAAPRQRIDRGEFYRSRPRLSESLPAEAASAEPPAMSFDLSPDDLSPDDATPYETGPGEASLLSAGPAPESWTRLRIQDDLELAVRSDFHRPETPHERRALRLAIETALERLLEEEDDQEPRT